jgi:hypothetical protein
VCYVHFSLLYKLENLQKQLHLSVAVAAALVDLFDSRREQQLRQTAEIGSQQLGQTVEISNYQLVQTARRLKQQLRGRDGLGRNVPAGSHTELINSGTCSEPVLQIMTLQ